MLSTFGSVTVGVRRVYIKVSQVDQLVTHLVDHLFSGLTFIDPYENCYAVVRGTKTFVLLPPIEYYCVHGKACTTML
jgi:Cupin-like domain